MTTTLLNGSHLPYRPDVDGLRAVAVWSVVGFHLFPEMVEGGFVGVDIFFVISGFLISSILLKSIFDNCYSLLDFYGRRIRRIFPSLLTVLLVCILFGWFVLMPDEYRQLGAHAAGGAGFVANIVLWNEAGYFDSAAELKPLLHLWSLGIEEQFYVLWPVLLWLALKKTPASALLLTAVLAGASLLWNVSTVVSHPVATFYSPQTRVWELLCGALLAWQAPHLRGMENSRMYAALKSRPWLTRINDRLLVCRNVHSNTFSILGAALVVYGLYTLNKGSHFPGSVALFPVVGTMLVIFAGKDAWLNRRFLSSRLLVWFGKVSFPLYLWHWPLLSFARILGADVTDIPIRGFVVSTSVVLAWFTYRWIEAPIRAGKNSLALVWAMALVAAAGLGVYANDGLAMRLTDKSRSIAEIFTNPLPTIESFDCGDVIPALRNVQFDLGCRLSKKASPTILFLGDSHMTHYKNAVWKEFSDHPILMVAQTSCLPFASYMFSSEKCKNRYEALIAFVKGSKTLKRIYVSGNWGYLMSGRYDKTGPNWRLAQSPDQQQVTDFLSRGRVFLETSLEGGKQVVFMHDIPNLDFDIRSCYDLRPARLHFGKQGECGLSYANYATRVSGQRDVISKLLSAYPQVTVFDPAALFCDAHICRHQDDALPFYYNGDHVNWFGADKVVKALAQLY